MYTAFALFVGWWGICRENTLGYDDTHKKGHIVGDKY